MGEEPKVQPEHEEPVDIICLEHGSRSQSRIFRVRCVSNVSMADLNISLWRYLALRPVLLLSLATAMTVKEYGLERYSLASSLLR